MEAALLFLKSEIDCCYYWWWCWGLCWNWRTWITSWFRCNIKL